jgi:serine/threonine protein kinase
LYAQKRLYLEPTSPQTTTNASTLGTTHGSTNSARDAAMNELEILRTVCQANHPNIIGLQDFFTKEPHLYIVMELADGDLAHLLYNRQPTPRRLLLEILAQIVRGVTHLHELGLCHRDLKPQNGIYMCICKLIFSFVYAWQCSDFQDR